MNQPPTPKEDGATLLGWIGAFAIGGILMLALFGLYALDYFVTHPQPTPTATSTVCTDDSYFLNGSCHYKCSDGYYQIHEADDQCLTPHEIMLWQEATATTTAPSAFVNNCLVKWNQSELREEFSSNDGLSACLIILPPRVDWYLYPNIPTSTPRLPTVTSTCARHYEMWTNNVLIASTTYPKGEPMCPLPQFFNFTGDPQVHETN